MAMPTRVESGRKLLLWVLSGAMLLLACSPRGVLNRKGELRANPHTDSLYFFRVTPSVEQPNPAFPPDSMSAKGDSSEVCCSLRSNALGEQTYSKCTNDKEKRNLEIEIRKRIVDNYTIYENDYKVSPDPPRVLVSVKYFDKKSGKGKEEEYGNAFRFLGLTIIEADAENRVVKTYPAKRKADSTVFRYSGDVLKEKLFYANGALYKKDEYEHAERGRIRRIVSCFPKGGTFDCSLAVDYFYRQ